MPHDSDTRCEIGARTSLQTGQMVEHFQFRFRGTITAIVPGDGLHPDHVTVATDNGPITVAHNQVRIPASPASPTPAP